MTAKRTTKSKRPSPDGNVRCIINRQGGPIINGGCVVAAGKNIAAVEIDMRSKRCEVEAESRSDDGSPVMWLGGDHALHLKAGKEKEPTEVCFRGLGGGTYSRLKSAATPFVCALQREAPDDAGGQRP